MTMVRGARFRGRRPVGNIHTEIFQSLAGDPFADIVIPPITESP